MENVSCYVSTEELSLLKEASEYSGLKLSAYLRNSSIVNARNLLKCSISKNQNPAQIELTQMEENHLI